MARRTETYGTVTLTHHATHAERAEALRHHPSRKPVKLECAVIGHAWSQDMARDGWRICIACEAIQPP